MNRSLVDEVEILNRRYSELTRGAVRVRQHLSLCEHGDQETLDAFDALTKALGIHDDVISYDRKTAEMAVCGET